MILRLIRGIPGSGKTTVSKKFGCLHLENDMFAMHDDRYVFDSDGHKECIKAVHEMTEKALSMHCDVVVSNTFTKLKYLTPFLDLAEEYGAEVKVYTVKGNHGSIHNVPDDIIQKMKDEWEDFEGEEIVWNDFDRRMI